MKDCEFFPTETINGVEIDNFTRHYIFCALWSSTDNSDESGGEPLDRNHNIHDLPTETLKQMKEDCDNFRQHEGVPELIEQAGEMRDYPEAAAGHDFWLTRNGHGAGFWGRDLGEVGDKLSNIAKTFGSADLYIGDDGKVYHF